MQAFSDFYFDRITDQTTVLLDKPSNFTGRAAKVFRQLLFRHISVHWAFLLDKVLHLLKPKLSDSMLFLWRTD